MCGTLGRIPAPSTGLFSCGLLLSRVSERCLLRKGAEAVEWAEQVRATTEGPREQTE